VFKTESRVVVILSRKEWGQLFYTDIENGAILDGTNRRGQGFLMVIPMMPNEIPVWYTSTRIYVDPQIFTVDQIAKFIEFKVSEQGGLVKKITLNDQYEHLIRRMESKASLIRLQTTQGALEQVENEIQKMNSLVAEKIELLNKKILGQSTTSIGPTPNLNVTYGIKNCQLDIKIIKLDEMYHQITTTQDYSLVINLWWVDNRNSRQNDHLDNKKLISTFNFKFFYDSQTSGWAHPIYYDVTDDTEKGVLFSYKDPEQLKVTFRYYDLKNPISSEVLIDEVFQLLLTNASANFARHI
jgi:hypothetical protein